MPKNYKIVILLSYDFGIKFFLDCVAMHSSTSNKPFIYEGEIIQSKF